MGGCISRQVTGEERPQNNRHNRSRQARPEGVIYPRGNLHLLREEVAQHYASREIDLNQARPVDFSNLETDSLTIPMHASQNTLRSRNQAMDSFSLEPNTNWAHADTYQNISKTVDFGKIDQDAACPISGYSLSQIKKPVALKVTNQNGDDIFHLMNCDALVRMINQSRNNALRHPITNEMTTVNEIKNNLFKIDQQPAVLQSN